MMTLTEIATHPLNSWQDVDALIAHAQNNGGGTLVADRLWAEIVKLHQRIEELGGYV